MVTRKTAEEIETLKHGGRLLAGVLAQVAGAVRPGVSAKALDTLAEKLIREAGGEPSFKGYNPYGAAIPYPAALCVSINDEVVHAIPTEDRILQDGDLVGLDIGMFWPQPATSDDQISWAALLRCLRNQPRHVHGHGIPRRHGSQRDEEFSHHDVSFRVWGKADP